MTLTKTAWIALPSITVTLLLGGQHAARGQADTPLIAFGRLVSNNPREIHVMNVGGTEQRMLTTGRNFTWSPDGSAIAFERGVAGDFGLYVINRDGSGLRRLVQARLCDGRPSWSPDGSRIAFSAPYKGNCAIYVVHADGARLARLTAPPKGVSEDVEPAWSPDGAQIAFSRLGDVYSIFAMNADGKSLRRLTRRIDSWLPIWSPDSQQIAFQGASGFLSKPDVFVVNRDGSGLRNVTRTPSPADREPRWSADGRTIVFQSFTGGRGKTEVHLISADGTKHVNLTRSPSFDGEPSWTPEGRIVFTSNRDGNRDIYVMDATGAGKTNLTNTPGGRTEHAAWSPTR
jgi:Tol biopolymer transport system component